MSKILANESWLNAPELQRVLGLLNQGEEAARVVGGAVRNALLAEPIGDIDISTTLLPDAVIELLEANDIKAVPTGLEHGTITAVVDGVAFEVTTLREDIETYGRHAVVRFGRDWREDAMRRDFTINALYVDMDGHVHDPLDGMADIEERRVRFIGNAEDRIMEDHLRILRFFRFFGWYGHGAPDREALKACVRNKGTLESISAERIWHELYKLLEAPDPQRAILWMRQSGILSAILPESEKWGIDAIPRLIRTGDELGWNYDPMLRLMGMIPPHAGALEVLAQRLKLSNRDHKRLEDWACSSSPSVEIETGEFAKLLYNGIPQGIIDAMRLELSRLREAGQNDDNALRDAASLNKLLDYAVGWQRPEFPLKGRDLIAKGMKPGEEMGVRLKYLEAQWVDSGFTISKDALLD